MRAQTPFARFDDVEEVDLDTGWLARLVFNSDLPLRTWRTQNLNERTRPKGANTPQSTCRKEYAWVDTYRTLLAAPPADVAEVLRGLEGLSFAA